MNNALETGPTTFQEIVSALSYALDLTVDAIPGHAVRTCVLSMRIAEELRLSIQERTDLFFVALLKDLGCSNNTERMFQLFGGDDRKIKYAIRMMSWNHQSLALAKTVWRQTLPQASYVRRVIRLLQLIVDQQLVNQELVQLRSTKGSYLATKMGLSERCAQAIHAMDEQWDGKGYPQGLSGREIPQLTRIVSVAQRLDLHHTEMGAEVAIQQVKEREQTQYDPEVVLAAASLHKQGRLWARLGSGYELDVCLDLGRECSLPASQRQIDIICETFAGVVDSKSSYLRSHSLGVMQASMVISDRLGLTEQQKQLTYRASLLHDIGALCIPNTVLNSSNKLTPKDWEIVRDHPLFTRRILTQIRGFQELARIAGEHHERLDGSGYPYGLVAEQLSIEARVIAVADVFGALTEARPYRDSFSRNHIVTILQNEAPLKLDSHCFEALMESLDFFDELFEQSADQRRRNSEDLALIRKELQLRLANTEDAAY